MKHKMYQAEIGSWEPSYYPSRKIGGFHESSKAAWELANKAYEELEGFEKECCQPMVVVVYVECALLDAICK